MQRAHETARPAFKVAAVLKGQLAMEDLALDLACRLERQPLGIDRSYDISRDAHALCDDHAVDGATLGDGERLTSDLALDDPVELDRTIEVHGTHDGNPWAYS